jgi:hypothetical protein
MKLYFLLLFSIAALSHSPTHAFFTGKDTVQDQSCDTTIFYGAVGQDLHRVQMIGSTVTDLGVVAPSSFSSLLSVAYGNDITTGSANRTWYSAKMNPNGIVKWNGQAWVTVVLDTLVYHNAGAYGPYVYFQHSGIPGSPNDQCISRLNANGSLTPIFTDTSLVFSVADISVDPFGNVYFFRGAQIGATSELTVIDSAGNIINSYQTTNFGTMVAIYGSMFFNGTLYVGQGTTIGQLFPITFSGTTATLGTGIPTPSGISYKDLASCHELTSLTSVNESIDHTYKIFPIPIVSDLTISGDFQNELFRISDIHGRELMNGTLKGRVDRIDLSELPSGMYFLKIGSGSKDTVHRIIKSE